MTEPQRVGLAYHEGGHAVVALALGIDVLYATIIPSVAEDYSAAVAPCPYSIRRASLVDAETMLAAGAVAETFPTPPVVSDCSNDYRVARIIAAKLNPLATSVELPSIAAVRWDAAARRARIILDANRSALESFAKALLHHGIISGERLPKNLILPIEAIACT